MTSAQTNLSPVFLYVTSGDGFYPDNSFVFHNNIAYTGHYGLVLLGDIPKIVAAAFHQRQEALAAAQVLAPLSRRAATDPGPGAAAAPGPGTAGRRLAPTSAPALQGITVQGVALQGVTVRFAGRPRPALADVSVFVPPRTVLGVTGPSGSGKSTLLKVAGGWLRPSEGRALIGGVPAAGAGRALLIGQHPYLFSGTLADNIALGQPGASRSRIWAAVEAAQLTGLLGRLPDGLDTVLGERGWSISGGEAQRVALARAFLSEASFIVVDEPTAHLDAATEAALIEPLARLLCGRTALVASHSDEVLGIAGRGATGSRTFVRRRTGRRASRTPG